MQLTRFTDLSLRVLMYLGVHPDTLATIGEVADAYRVPHSHLVKVVHRLATLGYVETVRGNGGGLRLARSPRLITVGAVVRDTEENLNVLDCFDLKNKDVDCPLLPTCALRSVLMRARDNFLSTLDGVTLQDLLPSGKTPQLLFKASSIMNSIRRAEGAEPAAQGEKS